MRFSTNVWFHYPAANLSIKVSEVTESIDNLFTGNLGYHSFSIVCFSGTGLVFKAGMRYSMGKSTTISLTSQTKGLLLDCGGHA